MNEARARPLVALDSNIFLDLFNYEAKNPDSHIEQLLAQLFKKGYAVGVDDKKKISGEYDTRVKPMIENGNETKFGLFFVRHWMKQENQMILEMDPADRLMAKIQTVIIEQNENVDRAFVYIAFRHDFKLVTNDETHIHNRRAELRRETKKLRGANADIFKSNEALPAFL